MLGMDYTSAKWHNVLGTVSILIGYAQGSCLVVEYPAEVQYDA